MNDVTQLETGANGVVPLLPPAVTATAKSQNVADRREQRLDELITQALEEADPLQAMVKTATAQLLDIGCRLGDEIKASIGSVHPKAKDHQDKIAAINTYLQVQRQATRYVQLDQQWAKSRGNKTASHGNHGNDME